MTTSEQARSGRGSASSAGGGTLTPRSSNAFSLFIVEGEVYFFVDASDGVEAISDSMYRGRSYPSIGVLSTIPSEAEVTERSTRDEKLLGEPAAGADHLIIGAYDQEAWLVWTRPSGEKQ